jgi:hypothetical protein
MDWVISFPITTHQCTCIWSDFPQFTISKGKHFSAVTHFEDKEDKKSGDLETEVFSLIQEVEA